MLSDDRKRVILLHPVRPNSNLMKHIGMTEGMKKMSGWIPKDSYSDRLKELDAFEKGDIYDMRAVPPAWNTEQPRSYGRAEDRIWDGIPFQLRAGNDMFIAGRIIRIEGMGRFHNKTKNRIAKVYCTIRMLFDKPKKEGWEIFPEIRANLSKLVRGDAKEEVIKAVIKTLARTKQVAAARSIKRERYLINIENKLLDAGYENYLSEEAFTRLVVQCKKGLCITELELFPLLIPNEIIDRIHAAEKTMLFDNYYIFYYDPKVANASHKMQRSAIFGVVDTSNKLYYIGDWECDYCLIGNALNTQREELFDNGSRITIVDLPLLSSNSIGVVSGQMPVAASPDDDGADVMVG